MRRQAMEGGQGREVLCEVAPTTISARLASALASALVAAFATLSIPATALAALAWAPGAARADVTAPPAGAPAGSPVRSLGGPVAAASLNERLWFREPARRQSQLSEVIVDQLTELCNELGYHLDVVSMDLVALRVDGRRRRMSLGVGASAGGYLAFRFDSDFHFIDGVARVTTRINLGLAGKSLDLQLPEVELVPTSYQGERGVEVRLPIVTGRF
jgi:hypothetical protein